MDGAKNSIDFTVPGFLKITDENGKQTLVYAYSMRKGNCTDKCFVYNFSLEELRRHPELLLQWPWNQNADHLYLDNDCGYNAGVKSIDSLTDDELLNCTQCLKELQQLLSGQKIRLPLPKEVAMVH